MYPIEKEPPSQQEKMNISLNSSKEAKFHKRCQVYNEYHIQTILSYIGTNYSNNLYCGVRITLDQFNIDVRMKLFISQLSNSFSKYMGDFYLILRSTIEIIANTFFFNLFTYSLELINSILLFIFYLTCLFYFLNSDSDFIMEVSKITFPYAFDNQNYTQ